MSVGPAKSGWLVFLVVAGFNIWIISHAGKIGYASLLENNATELANVVSQFDSSEDKRAKIQQALAALDKAGKLVPYDADVAILTGKANLLAAFLQDDSNARDALAEQAILHYERAIDLRPAWPNHYEDLLDLYYLTERPIEQRLVMLQGVVDYGKWDRFLKYFILDQMDQYEADLTPELVSARNKLIDFLDEESKSEEQAILEEIRSND